MLRVHLCRTERSTASACSSLSVIPQVHCFARSCFPKAFTNQYPVTCLFIISSSLAARAVNSNHVLPVCLQQMPFPKDEIMQCVISWTFLHKFKRSWRIFFFSSWTLFVNWSVVNNKINTGRKTINWNTIPFGGKVVPLSWGQWT